jgi:hypothetical protein
MGMPEFQLVLPGPVERGFSSLTLVGHAPITGEQFNAIAADTALPEPEMVARFHQRLRSGSLDLMLRAHLQVDEHADSDVKFSMHWRIGIEPSEPHVQEAVGKHWSTLYPSVVKHIGPIVNSVSLRFHLPAHGAITAIKLPVNLAPADVSGFSQVRGVRLVQMESADQEVELYSVVLDNHEDMVLVDARVPVELSIGDVTFEGAVQRAWSIAKYAVPSLREQV